MEKKLIPFNKEYSLIFLDEPIKKHFSPVSGYYFKINDLSVNLVISLKWIKWGYFFLDELSKNVSKMDNGLEYIMNKSIQKSDIKNIKKHEHILTIDDKIIKNNDNFENLIKTFYVAEIFNENSKIHMKLKINLDEYITITCMAHPLLTKIEIL